jgi:hypothetical protein
VHRARTPARDATVYPAPIGLPTGQPAGREDAEGPALAGPSASSGEALRQASISITATRYVSPTFFTPKSSWYCESVNSFVSLSLTKVMYRPS